MLRDLMLNQMQLWQMRNDRATHAACQWLKQFRFTARLIPRDSVLEVCTNDLMTMRVIKRLVNDHGFKIVKCIPWTPPKILHDDFIEEHAS